MRFRITDTSEAGVRKREAAYVTPAQAINRIAVIDENRVLNLDQR